MLKLVFGSDRTAVSENAVHQICDITKKKDERWILIVPEQFSFEAEKRLCEIGGDRIGRFAEVLSFSRLSDRVAAKVGGVAGDYLDKGGQLLTMAYAAEQVVSRIKYYAAVLMKPEFLSDMLRMIEEFRSYCLEPRDLLRAAESSQGQFAQKLEELGILYEAYLAVCSRGKADPSDKLLRLLNAIDSCQWIQEVHFSVDGFSDFTGIEQKILEQLMRYSPQVCVNLATGISGGIMEKAAHKTACELVASAKRHLVEHSAETMHSASGRDAAVRKALDYMFTYGNAEELLSDKIQLRSCASVADECRAAAAEVKRYLSKGARCREISIACTDVQLYEAPLREALQEAGVKAYFAGERGLLSKPIVAAVVNSVAAAVGAMEYEEVALYLKSPLPAIERDRCDRLDNYAYIWNIHGSMWEKEWTFHPAGFGEAFTPEYTQYLAELNADRVAAMEPLLRMRAELRKAHNTGEMIMAVYSFLNTVQLSERLEKKANEFAAEGKLQEAQELAQIYEILVGSMEQIWLTLGQTERTADNFCRLYQSVLTQYQVATIPAGLDQVHVSDLPDLRCRRTAHLLVLGASDGSFPGYGSSEGLLTEEERQILLQCGLTVAPGRADQMDRQIGRIYFALCAAEKTLYLSYCGEQPAWLFRRAVQLCPGSLKEARDAALNVREMAARRLRCEDTSECGIEEVVAEEEILSERAAYTFTPLEAQSVAGLYGSPLNLSPSKIDKYAACRFAFFANYGLRAKAKKRAKMDQPAFGTFVHAVLEHTVCRANEEGGLHVVSAERILEIAAEEIGRYAEAYFPEQESRAEFLFHRSKSEIRDIVFDLWEELRKSKFVPQFCELKFMTGAEMSPVMIDGQKAKCRVVGMVDRVDLYCDGQKTYVRVVDYKTGVKDFDYTDILNGAGLQMLIYLFALRTSGSDLLGSNDVEPAGVLYLPAKRDYPLTEPMPDDEVVELAHRSGRKRKGLIRAEEYLLAAMEEDPAAPVFMPYKNGRNGLSGDLATAEQMRMLERHVTRTIGEMADQIAGGDVMPNPIVRGQYGSCSYCDYKTVCHKDLGMQHERILAETSAADFWERLEQEENHG